MSKIIINSCYVEKLEFPKLPFSEPKKIISRSVWPAQTHADTIESQYVLLHRKSQKYMWIFYYFNFERNYGVLKSNLVLQLI